MMHYDEHRSDASKHLNSKKLLTFRNGLACQVHIFQFVDFNFLAIRFWKRKSVHLLPSEARPMAVLEAWYLREGKQNGRKACAFRQLRKCNDVGYLHLSTQYLHAHRLFFRSSLKQDAASSASVYKA